MSSKDDPFGSGGRTVIMSGCGQGRHGSAASGQAAARARSKHASEATIVEPKSASSPTGGKLPPRTVLATAQTQGSRIDSAQKLSLESLLKANSQVEYLTANAMLSAAAPVLMLLGHLRQVPTAVEADKLAEHLASSMEEFDRRIAHAGIDEAEARLARYALCETVDDIVQTLPGFGRAEWLPVGMLSRFFRPDAAGVGFFDALNQVLANPEPHSDLRELMHACLSLGFEGQYRDRPAAAGLDQVRRDVYDTLRYFRPRPAGELSPKWQGMSIPITRQRARAPLWAVAAAACALVAGAFFGMRGVVTDAGEAVAADLLALDAGPLPAIRHVSLQPISAAAPVVGAEPEPEPKPAQDVQLDRIRAALAAEIAAGKLSVDAKGQSIIVELNNLQMFQPGLATLKPEFNALVGPIASALSAETGPIKIVGHTDSEKPGRGSAFKSNYDLSVARARAVEKLVAPKVSDPTRVVVEGKGEDEPIADNATPEGRARNRRVALVIVRDDGHTMAASPASAE